jgi:hypothetical protein
MYETQLLGQRCMNRKNDRLKREKRGIDLEEKERLQVRTKEINHDKYSEEKARTVKRRRREEERKQIESQLFRRLQFCPSFIFFHRWSFPPYKQAWTYNALMYRQLLPLRLSHDFVPLSRLLHL